MIGFIITVFIIMSYVLIGNILHSEMLKLFAKFPHEPKVKMYNSFSNSTKNMIYLMFLFFWLPYAIFNIINWICGIIVKYND